MHVELVFLNPEPFLKEEAKTQRCRSVKQTKSQWFWSPGRWGGLLL